MIKKLLLSIVMLLSMQLSAQNLVNNSGFEGPYKSFYFKRFNVHNVLTQDWIRLGAAYVINPEYSVQKIYDYHHFDKNIIDKKLNGKNIVGINTYYIAKKINLNNGIDTCANGHIVTKLAHELELFKTYEVKVNMYIPAGPSIDSNYVRHIGFVLLNDFSVEYDLYNYNWKFNVQDFSTNQWFEKKWYVRPLCKLNYLMFGVFKDRDWPIKNEDSFLLYYIDNVSVTEVDEKQIELSKLPITPFCKCKADHRVEQNHPPNQLSLFYEPSEYELSETSKLKLDSLAIYLKKFPKSVFEVGGYTDDIGSDHLELSKNRTNQVIAYLIDFHHISPHRLLPKYIGNIERGSSEAIRQQNRRVDLQLSVSKIEQIFYKKALLSNNVDSAYYYLKRWLKLSNEQDQIYALFDFRLDFIKGKTAKWNEFVADIRKCYKKYKQPAKAFALDSMYVLDQKYKTSGGIIYELADVYQPFDTLGFSFPKVTPAEENRHDSLNYAWMIKYMDKNGWPNQSEVGERPSRAAYFIVDHNFDTVSLKKYVPILEAKCREGEANWSDYATMFDRMERTCGRPTQYGMQYMPDPQNPNRIILATYDNKEAVNERRKKIGLPTIKNFENVYFYIK